MAPSASSPGSARARYRVRDGPMLFVLELVGTSVANFLSLVVVTGAVMSQLDAQTAALMGELNPLVQVPPAIGAVLPGHPALAPQALLGNMSALGGPVVPGGNTVSAVGVKAYPLDTLLVAVGVGLAFAVGLRIAPGCQLNPTFTVAMATFGKRKWVHVLPCILAQLLGGLAACVLLWTCRLSLTKCNPDIYTGAVVCRDLPHIYGSMSLYGVTWPPEDPFTWRPGHSATGAEMSVVGRQELSIVGLWWNNIVFASMMVICIVPIFSGKVPDIAAPLLVGVVVMPFVAGQAVFGVNTNAALFMPGLVFCSFVGDWPRDMWSHANHYWVVVLVAPLIGAILGAHFLKALSWFTGEGGPLFVELPEETAGEGMLAMPECLESGARRLPG